MANAQDDELAKLRRQLAEKTAEAESFKAKADIKGIDDEIGQATEEIDDGLVEVVNVSGQEVTFNVGNGRRVKLKPKQHTRIEKLYAYPQRGMNPNGDPVPAVVEMLTDGRVVPWDHKKAAPFRTVYQNTVALRAKQDAMKKLQAQARGGG